MSKREELYVRQKGRCYYCDCACSISLVDSPFLFTLDHKVPRSKGGRSIRPNLVGACKSCNNLKGSMTVYEFLTWMQGKDLPALKGRPSIVNRRAARKERKRRAKEAVAHLASHKKPAMPKPPPDLGMVFSASLADFFPAA
jgi:CRISPR/Cas system Type II protein with McrA/HNH and RuvC-like nuclease domain